MKISIVTVCFNSKEFLTKTILSVKNQKFNDYEFIVIDGGSTDGSLAVLHSNSDFIDCLISEADKGIYDAMNKALTIAKGEWIFFLNAGDEFFNNDVLFDASKVLDFNYGFVTGGVVYRFLTKNILTFTKQKITPFYISVAHHQGTFIRTDILRNLKYSPKYKLRAETDFFFRAYRLGYKFKNTDIIFSNYDPYGVSSRISLRQFVEGFRIGYKYIPFYFLCFPAFYLITQVPKLIIRKFTTK